MEKSLTVYLSVIADVVLVYFEPLSPHNSQRIDGNQQHNEDNTYYHILTHAHTTKHHHQTQPNTIKHKHITNTTKQDTGPLHSKWHEACTGVRGMPKVRHSDTQASQSRVYRERERERARPDEWSLSLLLREKRENDRREKETTTTTPHPSLADITNKSARRDHVPDCDVAHQSHVSAHLFFFLAVNLWVTRASCFALHWRSDVLLQVSVCLCLCLCPAGAGRAGQSPRLDSQALCLTSSGRVLAFLCVSLVSQQHISHLFVRAMAVAASGYRRSVKTAPGGPSQQSWSPNSGQAAENESGSSVDLLVSEQGQQSSSSGLTLPQQHQQAGTQMQSALPPLDQPQGGSRQYRPAANDQTPTPTGAPVTPPAGANANSDVIVNAQLTHLISRDDEAHGQGATSKQDALMPDASMVRDIATPRRTTVGRCRKWCISAQPASGKRKCAACCMCGKRFAYGEARLQQ